MSADHPDVIAPPPLLYLGWLLGGVLLDRVLPPPPLPGPLRLAGAPLLAAGLALGGWFFTSMRRAGTPLDPYETPTALVVEGPFRLTRNPGYLGMALIYAGLSLLTGSRWPLALLPAAVATIDRGVISREERYLERRFGPAYADYRRRVRRWL